MRLFARLFSWLRRTRTVSAVNQETASSVAVLPLVADVDVALEESELYEADRGGAEIEPRAEVAPASFGETRMEAEQESAPNESGFRMRALTGNETRKMPALKTRHSPFDAPTRRVDLDEIARTLDARAASSRK